jgi:two-component system sensor histidine kinase KdpD
VGALAFYPAVRTSLLRDEENLLHTVAKQLTISLERELFYERSLAAERSQESERLLQTVLNSVSHEMRTPLTAIIGASSALQHPQIASNAEDRNELLAEVAGNAERLNRIVSNLLDMSRLSSGAFTLRKDWHDVNDLLSVILETNRRALANHKVELNTKDAVSLIRADSQLLEQAITNLILNAVTHTPSGATVLVSTWAEDRWLVITVSDNGPGIATDALARIFTSFYRAPGTPTGGSGLGLSIAKGIVEAHGGTITAANRAEGGACFTIRLPIEDQPGAPPAQGAE